MTTALCTLAIAAALAAAASPALAWSEPKCQRLEETNNDLCMTSLTMSGGRSGANQVFSLAIVQEPGGKPYASIAITDEAWSMPRRRDLRALIGPYV